MRIDKNTTIKLGDRNIVKIKIGDSVIWEKKTEPGIDYFYIENTYSGTNTISIKQTIKGSPDSSTYAKTLQYSKDKTNWNTITLSSTVYNITLNQGEKVYFRGNEGVLNYYANNGAIQAVTNILGTQTHTIGGNINTLVNYITPNKLTLTQGVFAGLFQNNTTITSAENLTLPPSSDGSLPIFAYYLMFSGCSALITPPSEISATKQEHASCSKMFLDCTQLKTPPALKSTILGNYCFTSIFKNCTSLISTPELTALTLATSCYQSAFEGCTSLNEISVYADDISATNCTTNWLSGVASSGTFNNYGSATYVTDSVNGIPTGWVEVVPPIESITANPDTFTIKSYNSSVKCTSTLTITTTTGITTTHTNSATLTVGENTGDSTRTLTETIPYKGSSYQVTIVQTANDVRPPMSWNVVSEGTYPFQLNSNGYYESTNKGQGSSYSYATLNYEGYDNLVLECINSSYANYDYGIISQPDVQLSESASDDGATGSTKVFKNFKGQSSTNPVQIVIPSDVGSHFITIKFRKNSNINSGNDSLQFRVIEPTT